MFKYVFFASVFLCSALELVGSEQEKREREYQQLGKQAKEHNNSIIFKHILTEKLTNELVSYAKQQQTSDAVTDKNNQNEWRAQDIKLALQDQYIKVLLEYFAKDERNKINVDDEESKINYLTETTRIWDNASDKARIEKQDNMFSRPVITAEERALYANAQQIEANKARLIKEIQDPSWEWKKAIKRRKKNQPGLNVPKNYQDKTNELDAQQKKWLKIEVDQIDGQPPITTESVKQYVVPWYLYPLRHFLYARDAVIFSSRSWCRLRPVTLSTEIKTHSQKELHNELGNSYDAAMQSVGFTNYTCRSVSAFGADTSFNGYRLALHELYIAITRLEKMCKGADGLKLDYDFETLRDRWVRELSHCQLETEIKSKKNGLQ